jgi:outer membrane protein TolC
MTVLSRFAKYTRAIVSFSLLALFVAAGAAVAAEQPPEQVNLRPELPSQQRFSLSASIDAAIKNYPSIVAAESRARERSAEVTLVKTTYLPTLDLFVQELRGSVNNALGILFPPLNIPQVAGQASAPINFNSVWASNASSFMSWKVADFGLRHSQVLEAKTNVQRAEATTALTRFGVATKAADTYFSLIAAEEEVRAQKAGLERMRVFAKTVETMVGADLKPGVDNSRVEAELALAENKLIEAEQTRDIRRADFAQALGVAGTFIEADPGILMKVQPGAGPQQAPNFTFHPLALQQEAEIKSVQARMNVLKHEWVPEIYLEAGLFGRGSGANYKESIAKLGYLPNIPNWAVGAKIQFHVIQYYEIKAKEKMTSNEESAQRAHYAEVMQVLLGDNARAQALIEGAQKLAANAPKFLKAAQETEMRSRARYNVGLVDINSIAVAERVLIQAEVTNNLAALAVWRAYLAAAEAHGDFAPLLKLIDDASRGN